MNDEEMIQIILEGIDWQWNYTYNIILGKRLNQYSLMHLINGWVYIKLIHESKGSAHGNIKRLFEEKDLKERIEGKAVLEYI